MLDLAAEGRYGAARLDEADVRRLQAMKTGAILAFSVEAGAILAGPTGRRGSASSPMGARSGPPFRWRTTSSTGKPRPMLMGKRTGKDREKGKATLVDLLGLDGARRECDRLLAQALGALERFGSAGETLREAARFTVERRT